jgi:hypothetical protein
MVAGLQRLGAGEVARGKAGGKIRDKKVEGGRGLGDELLGGHGWWLGLEFGDAGEEGLGVAAAGEDVGELGEGAAELRGGGAVAPAGGGQVLAGTLHGRGDGMDEGGHVSAGAEGR